MPGEQTQNFDLVIELVPGEIANILGVAFDTDNLLGTLLGGAVEFAGFNLEVSMDRPGDVGLPADALNPIDLQIEFLDGLGSVRIVAGIDTNRDAPDVDLIQVNLKDLLYHVSVDLVVPLPGLSQILENNLRSTETIPLLPVPVNRGTDDPKALQAADVRLIDDTGGTDQDALAFCLTFGGGGPGDLAAFQSAFLSAGDTAGVAIFFGWLCRVLQPEIEGALELPAGAFEDCVLQETVTIDDDEDVELTAMSLRLEDGFIAFSATVRKSGFCYEGTGTITGRLRIEVEDGELIVEAEIDDPEIDLDVPWYCWLGAAALGAILGGVLLGAIGALVGGVLVPLIVFIVSEVVEGVLQAVADTLQDALNAIAPDIQVPAVVFNFLFQQVFIDDITITAKIAIEDNAPVKTEGTAVLRRGEAIDLDTGRVGDRELPGADLEWVGDGKGRRLLALCITELARTGSKDFGAQTRFKLYGYPYESPAQVLVQELATVIDLIFVELSFPSLFVYGARTTDGCWSAVQVVEVKEDYIRLRYRTYAHKVQSVEIRGGFRCTPFVRPDAPGGVVYDPPPAGQDDDVGLPLPPVDEPDYDPDCPPTVVQRKRPEAQIDLGRLVEASRSVGAAPNVMVSLDGDLIAELDPKLAARWSGLVAQPLRVFTGQWTVDYIFQRRPFATFHAVTEGLEGEIGYKWFVNGALLEEAEGEVDASGLVMTYRIVENRINFRVKEGGTEEHEFELKVAVDDEKGAHLETTRCIHFENTCRRKGRKTPPFVVYRKAFQAGFGTLAANRAAQVPAVARLR